MSCCGKGRAAATKMYGAASATPGTIRAGTGRTGTPGATRSGPGTTRLRYTGTRPASVRGSATGRTYGVRRGDVLPIDTRDVSALLRTGLFTRA
jgi:hypothetical protein